MKCSYARCGIIIRLNIVSVGRRGRDRMVVGVTTTYAISAYHQWCCEFESLSGRGVQQSLCNKVCQWLATSRWFSLGTPVSSTNKTDRHDITEILWRVALNNKANKQTNKQTLNIVCTLLIEYVVYEAVK